MARRRGGGSVAVTVKGLDIVQKILASFEQPELDKRQKRALLVGARVLRKHIRAATPVGPTGNLRRAVRAKALRDRPGLGPAAVAGIRTGRSGRLREKTETGLRAQDWAPHGGLVTGGTRPHTIRARGKAMAFEGRVVRSVQHPGTAPNAFVARAVGAHLQGAIRAYEAELFKEIE